MVAGSTHKRFAKLKKLLNIYSEPAFLICTIVLVVACSFMSLAIKGFADFVKKEPLPLKKSLDLLDEDKKALGCYKVLSKQKVLNEQIVNELGTEDYIEWTLENTEEPSDSPVRMCSLFITYYRMPDRIPHVPDECYVGVGYQRLAGNNINFKVNIDGVEQELPGRCVIFSSVGDNYWSSRKFPVLYLFRVNDEYCGNRESARVALDKNLFGRHSFFSKVELRFFNDNFGSKTSLSMDEAIQAGSKFLEVFLPILQKEHWPDSVQ